MAKHRDTPLSPTPDPGPRQNYAEVRKIDSILNANKDKEWVRRLYDKNPESIQIKGLKGRSTHYIESADNRVYPTVDRSPKTNKLIYMGDTAYQFHDRKKSYIALKDEKEAAWFGENYKKGTGVLSGSKKNSKGK